MTYSAPDHYSYDFKFDVERLPTTQKDRLPNRLSVLGIIFGFFLFALGALELASYFLGSGFQGYEFELPQQDIAETLKLQRLSFDALLIGLGLCVLIISVFSLYQYKEIFFDGENIKIIHKKPFKKEQMEIENLYNYLGILLKVEYFQLGLINRNRYIIEMYHKDKNKRVPLYMSTSGKDVRKIWEYYSARLHLPALFMTDHGLISRNQNELKKTLRDMAKKWKTASLYRDEKAPSSLSVSAKDDVVTIKENRLFFDVYSILSLLGILIIGFVGVYALLNASVIIHYIGQVWFAFGLVVCLALICFSLLVIFSKDVMIIDKEYITLGYSVPFLDIDAQMIEKDKIQAVDIGHNPTTERYYLTVISPDKTIIFGKNMPIEDLRWIRSFVIRETVKK
ncbi:MAG: hypothetical protein IKO06_03480 [Alphaproteobacteria bacterium]|nr:hypothetical protein [Alphaproteobacteria bacterium]